MRLVFILPCVLVSLPLVHSEEVPASLDAVALLNKRMDAFEAENKQLKAIVKVMTANNENLNARINALEDLTTYQQQEIQRLVTLSEEHTTANERSKDRIAALEESDTPKSEDRNRPEVNKQESRIAIQHNKPSVHDGSRIRKAAYTDRTVAFFSTLGNHLFNPGVHQTIVFENVITNIGNGYNSHAGDFRAPVKGVYAFSTTLMSGTAATPYHFKIMRNGTAVSNIYNDHGGTVTMDAVLYLNAGEDVAIHNMDAGQKVYGGSYSSFSGFLLREDESEFGLIGK